MLYHLFQYLGSIYDIPGARLFNYLSFRAGMSVMLALLVGIVFGKRIIRFLRRRTLCDSIRDLNLAGQMQKQGTPTMGGIVILISVLVPVLLFANLASMYTWLLIVTLVWLSALGFIDDYIKVFRKNKNGLRGIYKVIGQAGIGIVVSMTICLHSDFVVRPKSAPHAREAQQITAESGGHKRTMYVGREQKSTITTIPFFKNNEFNYKSLVPQRLHAYADTLGWAVFILACIFIIIAVSNGANLTDGMDGLAAGTSVFIAVTLGILAYLSGNVIYADYLQILYLPNSGEAAVFMAALVGALVGFLWYNTYPSQAFMGDTGSLALGGDTQGVDAACAVWCVLCREFVGDSAGGVVQVHTPQVWRGQADIPDVAPAPSLPKERHTREQDSNAVLYHSRLACSSGSADAQGEVNTGTQGRDATFCVSTTDTLINIK